MNTSVKAVEGYISEVARLAKSGITTEHTFRGALAMLLDALAPNLKAFNEPKRTECGAPDYIVQDKTGLGVFYVEAKDLGDDDLGGKKRTGHKEQFDRYKAALDTIIFTDYLDFHLYRHGEFVSSVKIGDYDGAGKVSEISGAYEKLAELIKEASLSTPQKIDSSKRLAELMAGKARLLQRNAAKFLTPLTKAYDDAPSHAKPPVTPILELLMASYTMAHIKIDFALRETFGKCCQCDTVANSNSQFQLETGNTGNGNTSTLATLPPLKQRFNVFLTDSLSPWHKELPGGLFASALAPEQKGSDEVKRDTPVMVVLGNPPYNVSSTNKSDWIQNLVADYKKNLNERKINLDDDYIKFIRLGQHYVDKNEEGIIAYITNNSYLDGITHRQMRKSLMESFDEIYVLNLHGNARKKEVAPDGGKDENVFNIMQGVAITLFVKCKGSTGLTRLTGLKDETKNLVNPVKNNCRVYYADLWGKKKEKLVALDEATMESIDWKELKLTEPYYFFVPKDFALEDEYNEGFSISELFSVNNSGIQTKRDKVVYRYEVRDIKMVVSDFAKCSEMEIRQRYALPADGRDWTVAWAKDDVSKGGGQFVNVHYHPFDKRWTYFTGHTSGFMAYPRMPASCHMLCDNVALLAVRNSRGDLANNYFVADTIVDKDGVSSLDNCRFFPLYLYEENMGKMEKRANLDKGIVEKLCASASLREEPSPEDIFDYIYGVLHSPAYRTKFKEFLKVDFPRIPYPKDLGEFERFRAAGSELRAVHLMKDAEPSLFEAHGRFPIAGDNVVDAVKWDNGRVYINRAQYFDNVPLEAWEQAIGGYCPAEKYLKDRKNRALSQEELKHYQRIILALAKTREIMDGL